MKKEVSSKIAGLINNDSDIPTPIGDVNIRYLQINTHSLGKDMQDQAAIYGWVASAWVAAKTDVANIEQQIDERESYLWGLMRRQKEEGIKLTIKDMEQEIESDPNIQELKKSLIIAESNASRLDVLRRAFEQKASMIQSMVGLERSKIEQQIQSERALIGEKIASSKD